jgi:uracil-DNA glycosylase
MQTWEDLEFWNSPEWEQVQEKLDALEDRGILLCPRRELLFASLDATPLDTVKVVIMGQDPYPDVVDATGIAFSIPSNVKYFPYSLSIILKEYVNDLHYPLPDNGCLTKWCEEGVLLWNAVPSTEHGRTMAHTSWEDWKVLSTELVRVLSGQGIVFVCLGRLAQQYGAKAQIYGKNSSCITLAHPAAERYGRRHKNLFSGSRIFTQINDRLVTLGKRPINWRLDHGKDENAEPERPGALREDLGCIQQSW